MTRFACPHLDATDQAECGIGRSDSRRALHDVENLGEQFAFDASWVIASHDSKAAMLSLPIGTGGDHDSPSVSLDTEFATSVSATTYGDFHPSP